MDTSLGCMLEDISGMRNLSSRHQSVQQKGILSFWMLDGDQPSKYEIKVSFILHVHATVIYI